MSITETPQGAVVALGIPDSQDYPRLVYCAPYFTQVPLAELIEPAVTEAVEAMLPSLVPPYVDQAANAAVQQLAVLLAGSTMSGPLFLNPVMPTQPAQAASMAYVDAMIATAGVPEVPATPIGQTWARQVGQWVPISSEEGTFLPLAGGTMQGSINMSGNTITNMAALPVMPNGAAPAQWVLSQIASVSLYQGLWDMDTYTPDLTQLSTHVNGYTWIAITASTSGVDIVPAIPGLQGKTIFNGDTVIWSNTAGAFQYIHAGGLSLPEAEALFLQLAGGQMSGPLLLNADATSAMQAVTYQQFEGAISGFVTPDAPGDGQAYLRIGLTHAWTPGVPITGATMTGALILSGNATNGLGAVTLNQLNATLTGAFVPISGGTMTGLLVLSGNATAGFNPVPLSQMNASLGAYLPLGGGTLTGSLGVNPTAASSVAAPLTVGGQGISYNAFAGGANIAFSYTAPNFFAYVGGTQIGPLMTSAQVAGAYIPLSGGTATGTLATTNTGDISSGRNLNVAGWAQISGNNGSGLALNIVNGYVNIVTPAGDNGITITGGTGGANIDAAGNIIGRNGLQSGNALQVTNGAASSIYCTTLSLTGASGGGNLNASGQGYFGTTLTVQGWEQIDGNNGSGLALNCISGGIAANGNQGGYFAAGIQANNGNLFASWSGATDSKCILANTQATWQLGSSAGNASFYIWNGGSSGSMAMSISSANAVTFPSFLTVGSTFYCYHIQPENNGSVNCGQIAEAWSNVYSYNYPAPSDPSLKNEVAAPAPGALALVEACPTVQFKWRPEAGAGLDPNRLHRGFLTTDVERYVDAELVVKDPEGKGPDCLHMNELIAVLWQAVQELAAQVKALTPAAA